MAAAMKFCFLVSFKYTWFLFVFVFQYYGTSQSSKILVLLHLFKGNQVFKFKTEHKINVYFLIFIALPIVHCTRHYWGVIGPQSRSKWPKMPFCGPEPVLWIQTGGTRLEQVKAHLGNVIEPFLWSRMLIGGPITPKMSQKELKGAITDHKRPFWGTIAPLDSHSWPVKWFHDIARVC